MEKLLLAVAIGLLVTFGNSLDGLAQKAKAPDKAAETTKPAKKAAEQKTAPAKKAATKKSAKKKKTASACQGLKKGACEQKKECGWIVPKKKVDKRGRKLTAYCRKTAGIAKGKKKAAKAAPKKQAVKKPAAKKKN